MNHNDREIYLNKYASGNTFMWMQDKEREEELKEEVTEDEENLDAYEKEQ